jgi:O-6-methylguanine DNA methyltransferase
MVSMTADAMFFRFLPKTPVGPMVLGASLRGVRTLEFRGGAGCMTDSGAQTGVETGVEAGIAAGVHGHLDIAMGLLEALFRGDRMEISDLLIDWTGQSGFSREVLGALSRVPWGRQTTYGALAAAIGHPRAARAVGQAVGANPLPILIPCHRVLPASGGLGGFSAGVDRKEILLRLEGWRGGLTPER